MSVNEIPRAFLLAVALVSACGRSSSDFRRVAGAPARAAADSGVAVDSVREYRGYWTVGFEEGRFVPCDTVLRGAVWLRPPADVWTAYEWPKGDRVQDGMASRYYVRVRGVLRGGPPNPPSFRAPRYGHLGIALYELEVVEVLEARPGRRGPCRPPTRDAF